MRLRGALFAAALLAAAPALAQERGGEKIDWAKRLDALFEALQREEEEFAKATAAAPPGPDGTPAMPDMSKHPGRKRLPEFLEIARGAKGSDAGVKAAHWILTRGSGLPGGEGLEKEAFRLLVEEAKDCPALIEVLPIVRRQAGRFPPEAIEAALVALATKSADAEVRVTAEVQRAASRLEDPRANAERRAEGRRIAEEVVAKNPGSRAARRAKGLLTEMDRLQIGKEAPDFEAVDAAGAKFRLSDYRGSVVIVDFWSGWGRGSRQQAPAWAKAAEKWKDRPFAFLAICCNDGGPAEAIKDAKEYGVPGRVVAAGGREGDLPVSWNVRIWPTLYVIDADGIVRWSGPAGPWETVADEWIRAAEAK